MAETTKKSKTGSGDGFTADERAAMKERAAELRAEKRREKGAAAEAADAKAVVDKIAEMVDADRVLAERIHSIVTTTAPQLAPKLWYGMPAYARDGKIVCFFQDANKFKARYATLGFNDAANLDDGGVWATSFAITELSDEDEARIADLVRRAVS